MKRSLVMFLVLALCMALLAGCSSNSNTPTVTSSAASPPATKESQAAETSPVAEPESSGPDWESMTDEELYEIAKSEGGVINIYTSSSRVGKAMSKFSEMYPGVAEVVAHDMKGNEIPQKVKIETDTGNRNADVLCMSDNAGEITIEFAALGFIEEYKPKDIISHIDPALTTRGLPLYASLSYWFYNTKAFPDGCPITNWWDFVEKDANGNQVYDLVAKEIGSEQTYLALLCNLVKDADLMAEAYKAKYGTDVEFTYDASQTPGIPENNAGFEFIYRLARSQITYISGGDEIVEAVHNSTADKPRVGLASAGKITTRDELGYDIAWITDLKPYPNMQNLTFLMLVAGTDNPAGARLVIRYLAGGADGQAPGFKSMLKEGTWSLRDDYVFDGNPFAIQDSGAVVPDTQYIYDNYYNIQDFWIYWQNKKA